MCKPDHAARDGAATIAGMSEQEPPRPEVTLAELLELARQLEAHPENRPGSDKTWVLDRLRSLQAFFREPRTRNDPPLYDPPGPAARRDPPA